MEPEVVDLLLSGIEYPVLKEEDNDMEYFQSINEPHPSRVRGKCPLCGDVVVSNLYYRANKGYLLRWECWKSLGVDSTCTYSKIL